MAGFAHSSLQNSHIGRATSVHVPHVTPQISAGARSGLLLSQIAKLQCSGETMLL